MLGFFFRLTSALFCATLLAACSPGKGSNNLGSSATLTPAQVSDFANSTFVTNDAGTADGVSILTVTLRLLNSDDSPVPNFTPMYQIVSGTGLVGTRCSVSDAQGISTCGFTSVSPGTSTIALLNAKVGLSALINFNAPLGGQRGSLASGSRISTTAAGGFVVKMSFGNSVHGHQLQTYDGYRVTFTMQNPSAQ